MKTAASTSVSPKSGAYAWQVVAMLWAISFFNYADRQAIFSVFPLLQQQFHLSDIQLGLLGSSFAWVYGLGALFAGIVVDRVRRKTAILAGLEVWSFICMATALATQFSSLVILRALEGLGETFYYPASMSLVSDYHGPRTRSRAIGFHQTSVYVGTIAGGFFAGYIGQTYGWRWSFIVFGGLGALLGLVLVRFLKEPQRGAAENLIPQPSLALADGLRTILRQPAVLMLMGAFTCANFVAVVLLTWMPKFLHDKYGMGLAASGLTATIFVQLASMAGSPVGGWLADKLRARTPAGRIIVQALGVFGGAPFVVLCGLTQSITLLLIALTAWGLFKGLYDANIFASVFDFVRPEARGTTAGLMNTVGWLAGGGSAPVVIGWIAQSHGLGTAIALAAVVYLFAGLFLLGAISIARKQGATVLLASACFLVMSPALFSQNVTIFDEPGRFGGWPANHGIWSWGDEILVGFSDATFLKKDADRHQYDGTKPELPRLARSLNGGLTWKVEAPSSLVPPEQGGAKERDLDAPMDFNAPGFAMTLRFTNTNQGPSRLWYSTDHGHTWQGPFRFPLFGHTGVAARTDYLIEGKRSALVFLTAAKVNGKEGRPFCARTTDGGLTWKFVSYLGSEPEGFSIMPSSVRISPSTILTAVRVKKDLETNWIDLYQSTDNAASWQLLPRPVASTGGGSGNPPSMIKLRDGRICLTYGYRSPPYSIRAVISADNGQTWGKEIVIRADGAAWDLGYPRTVQRVDGKVVTIYYFPEQPFKERILAATIWDPK